jgi:hypothetical protein
MIQVLPSHAYIPVSLLDARHNIIGMSAMVSGIPHEPLPRILAIVLQRFAATDRPLTHML